MPIPKIYHPFIAGANNSTAKKIMEQTGARINIPPPSVNKDELTVAGEKEGVASAIKTINDIFEEKVTTGFSSSWEEYYFVHVLLMYIGQHFTTNDAA